MKKETPFKKEEATEDPDGYYEEVYPPWKKKSWTSYIPGPAVFICAGLFVVVIVLSAMVFGSRKTGDNSQIPMILDRIAQLEDRFYQIEADDKDFSAIKAKVEKAQSLKERLDRLEQVVTRSTTEAEGKIEEFSKKIDTLGDQIDALKTAGKTASSASAARSSAKPAPAAKKPAAPAAKSSTQYHIVKPGETLYRISLKYGKSVNELIKMNNLKNGTDIHPNQKLIVGK